MTDEPRNAWYLAPFFGRRPALAPEQIRVLGLVALGVGFEQYDIGLLNAALPQLARDLGIAPGETGVVLGAIRVGGIGSVALLPFADRFGRRRLFLLSMLGMGLGTLATAASPTVEVFAALQFATRIFMLTVVALGIVILVEELPADRRGAGLGFLAVTSGLGFGFAAGLYAAVDLLPGGWRALYVIGVLPVALLPFFRRALPETRRFRAQRQDPGRGAFRAWLAPVRALLRESPRRALLVGLAATASSMAGIVFFQYASYFVQEAHGWAPGEYTVLVFAAGALGILGSVLAGRGSDRFGRRRIGLMAYLLAPTGVALFYNGPEGTLVPAWALAVFLIGGGDVIVRALAGELFPTSHRSTSLGWTTLLQTVGWASGLFVVGIASDSLEDLVRAITWVSGATVIAGLALLALPETRALELEEIQEDR